MRDFETEMRLSELRDEIAEQVLSKFASRLHSDRHPHAHSGDEIDYHNDQIDQKARELVALLESTRRPVEGDQMWKNVAFEGRGRRSLTLENCRITMGSGESFTISLDSQGLFRFEMRS